MSNIFFYVFGLTALGAAVLAVTRKNTVASAMWLILMFFGLAGCYVLLEAWFVATVQVLVYAGAIMVLFLFVIMLLDLRSDSLESRSRPKFQALGVLTALLFLIGAGYGVWKTARLASPTAGASDPQAEFFDGPVEALDASAGGIGDEIFGTWLLAFEVTSVLLLGAILGAVILTKRRLL